MALSCYLCSAGWLCTGSVWRCVKSSVSTRKGPCLEWTSLCSQTRQMKCHSSWRAALPRSKVGLSLSRSYFPPLTPKRSMLGIRSGLVRCNCHLLVFLRVCTEWVDPNLAFKSSVRPLRRRRSWWIFLTTHRMISPPCLSTSLKRYKAFCKN